jgi:hypothetical protein
LSTISYISLFRRHDISNRLVPFLWVFFKKKGSVNHMLIGCFEFNAVCNSTSIM